MFLLYQSNRLETLSEVCASVLSRPVGGALEPEVVLVQSQGMQRWLQFELARRQGIAANLDVQLPAGFIWRLLNRLVDGVPKRSPFDAEVLAWRFHHLLPRVFEKAPTLAAAWQEATERGRYNLAWRVADVFDQYLIYRPLWLEAWTEGRLLGLETEPQDEPWQAALWRELTRPWARAADTPYRANLLRQLQQRLQEVPASELPKRLCIFGISNLPAVYRELLEALSARIPVYLFLQNPCREFWGDVRRGQSDGVDENPLLSSWGGQGKAFVEAVTAGDAQDLLPPEFHDYPAHLLGALQQDILLRRQRPADERLPLAASDDSLRLHVCHSAMREVEVLHDELRRRFEQDPTLQPHDVLVMTTDIARFAPLIDAVFGAETGERRIPWTIADRNSREENPLLDTFRQLLALPQSRFEQETVLGLLAEPLLAAAFGIGEAELPVITRWLRELHLRWGLDDDARQREGLPPAGFTWQHVLDRLFMGYALPPALADGEDARHAGILPADLVEGSRAVLLARLYRFVQALAKLSRELQRARTLADWAVFLHDMIGDFFREDDGEALQTLRDLAGELAAQAELAGSTDAVPVAVLLAWYDRHAQGRPGRRGFLQGAVTVCAMVPMRSLPFRVIAVLGLDDGVFPRHQRPWPFDLMRLQPQPGDRSRREDDRYLFLETLLAAGEALHLSHVGRSQLDGSVRPPSPVLAELLDVIDNTATAPDGGSACAWIRREHSLQPFSPMNFLPLPDASQPRYRSYDAAAFAATLRLQSQQAAQGAGTVPDFRLPPPAEPVQEIEAEKWIRGLRNPARLLLRERFGIHPAWSEELLPGEEPIALERDAAQTLRESLFAGSSLPADYWAATGLLPAAAWGERLLERERDAVSRLQARLPEGALDFLPPQDARIEIDGLGLLLHWGQLHADGQRQWLFREISAGDRVALWLRHLLLCAAAPAGVALRSELYALKGRTVVFRAVENAPALLQDWVAAWREAQCGPLPFFPRSSWAFVESAGDEERALAAWQGHDFVRGEGADSAARTLWGNDAPVWHADFASWAMRLLAPMQAHTESTGRKTGEQA